MLRRFLQTLSTRRSTSPAKRLMDPVNNQQPQKFGNFDLLRAFQAPGDISITKYRSRTTGLSIVHLDYDAPIVNGYFVVPTEIFDDSGCPHTLEHLVFMGSEKYPYKGIIDHFANRGFSNGTNAWTDTDHTAYTVSTAGSQGFMSLLPIYLDHILYPTITKAGYVTEVHHIDPKGQDSGVVYSEMQGRENTPGDRMSLHLQRLLDPPGSAYRSETGGLMGAIRVLTVEQIRQYHAKYYVPHNLTLIVAGKLSGGTTSLLSVVQEEVEPSIIAHNQDRGPRPPGWRRPFLETPSAERPPIPKTIKETIDFPEKDESVGEIIINFLGPPPNEFVERKALDILGTYLTSSAVAPLNKEYIETESPLCTYIEFSEDTRATKVNLPIYIGSVPTELLDTFDTKLQASLRRIADEGVDMQRIAMVINRDERQLRSKLESAKGDTFSGTVITDLLYGHEDGSDMEASTDEITNYNVVRNWTSQQWSDLIYKYFIHAKSVVVIGRPSAALVDQLKNDEETRIAKQVEALGPDGLKRAEKTLEEAKAEHDRPIPTDVLNKFPIPDVKSISWIPVHSVQQPGKGRKVVASSDPDLAKHIEADGSQLPFFVQYDHVESDFVTIHGFFSLANLPNRLRPLITTYVSSFFALPVTRQSGERLTHEEVVNKLDDETVSYEVSLGMGGGFSEVLRVSLQVETSAYETAVAWMRDLLYGAEFDKTRLQVTVAKIQQSLPEMKRDGNTVLGSVWADLIYADNSSSRAGGILPQLDFIPQLSKELQGNPDKVVADLQEIRQFLTAPNGIRFSVAGNVQKLANPRSVWGKHFHELKDSLLSPVPLTCNTLSDAGKDPVKKAIVFTVPTIESSYATHTSKCIQGFTHPEYPAIRVALEVLNATESYLWRYIRGSGLAYGAYASLDLEAGLLSFSLYRSSNSVGAFKEASKVFKGLADGSIALDDTTIAAAKSSIVYGITRSVGNAGRAANISFLNQALKGVDARYHVELLERFQSVTKDDILSALQQHFLPLCQPSSSIAVVATGLAKAQEIAESFESLGFDVEKRRLEVDPDELEESGSDSESDSSVSTH